MILRYKEWFPKWKDRTWFAPDSTIIGNVEFGEDCSVWFGSVIRGDVHYIKIGDRTNIQDLTMIHVTHYKKSDMSDGYPTIIGNDVTVGHRVMLHGCIIEDACLIGMNSTILDGAVIGKESIVGAGALVTQNKKFPPRSLILGAPARVVRELSDKEVEELYASAKRYVNFKEQYRNNIR
ncbi:MAG: gamma carbonic anhydrase family protein [Epsilonproteobacteria bacterium]|nr:gamma carbonic anhydrase family protein [Campylobacterota bacterium]